MLIFYVIPRRVFLDGLVRAGTANSVEVIVELIKNHKLNGFENQVALLSLGNAKYASNEAVKAAAVRNINELKILTVLNSPLTNCCGPGPRLSNL